MANCFYDRAYYCAKCGTWIEKSHAERDCRGNPICPKCHNRLRTIARHYKRKGKL